MAGKEGDRGGVRKPDLKMLVSKSEEGPMGQAVQAASRSWKKQENEFSPDHPKETQPH